MVIIYGISGNDIHSGILTDSILNYSLKRLHANSTFTESGLEWEQKIEAELDTVEPDHSSYTVRVTTQSVHVGEYTHDGWMSILQLSAVDDMPDKKYFFTHYLKSQMQYNKTVQQVASEQLSTEAFNELRQESDKMDEIV